MLDDYFDHITLSMEDNLQILLGTAFTIGSFHTLIGIDHSQIGEWLCDQWNFPKHIQESVAFHHQPELSEQHGKMVAIVHIGNVISRLERLGFSGDDIPPEINPQSWEILNIPEEELGELIIEIKEDYEKSSVFLELLN